jgi:hypothetical protein
MLGTELSKEIADLALEHAALEAEQKRAEDRLESVLGRKFEVSIRLTFLRTVEERMESGRLTGRRQ